MGKRCDCAAVLAAFEGDPRVIGLPLAVRALWLLLVRKMQAMGGVALVLGSDIPNLAEVARMVAVSETELETHLVPLLSRGLLVRREDGALECPLLAVRAKRSETARINGLKGGRPRKDGSPPRQREMIMVVPGGGAAPVAETQAKPSGAAGVSLAKLAEVSQEEAKPADAGGDWQRVGAAAMEAAGFDPVRWTGHCGLVRTWMQAGASEALIVRVIRRVMERGTAQPSHFGYFDKAVRAELAQEPPVVAEVASADGGAGARAYVARYQAWLDAGMPGAPPLRAVAA